MTFVGAALQNSMYQVCCGLTWYQVFPRFTYKAPEENVVETTHTRTPFPEAQTGRVVLKSQSGLLSLVSVHSDWIFPTEL